MWVLCAFLTWVNILFFAVLVSAHEHGVLGFTDLKSVDLATIALLSSTLVLIAVGIGVAVLTLIGYREIRASAIAAATAAATLKAGRTSPDSVATRIARETRPTETTDDEAARIAQAEDGPAG